MIADGGYDLYDAHLVGALKSSPKNHNFGYNYPNGYLSSNAVDSPARIAQQLFKNGIKRQRYEMLNNRSAALIQESLASKQKFTILDEPRFTGFGKVELSSAREARLTCSFNEAIDQTNVSVTSIHSSIRHLRPTKTGVLHHSDLCGSSSPGPTTARGHSETKFNQRSTARTTNAGLRRWRQRRTSDTSSITDPQHRLLS